MMESIIEQMRNQPTMTISAAAAAAGLHPQTIRSYEQRGLITPYRTPGGTRMYSYTDLIKLNMISSLSQSGIGIEGISKIMEMQDEIEAMRSEMKAVVEENMALRSALHKERARRRAAASEADETAEECALMRLPAAWGLRHF